MSEKCRSNSSAKAPGSSRERAIAAASVASAPPDLLITINCQAPDQKFHCESRQPAMELFEGDRQVLLSNAHEAQRGRFIVKARVLILVFVLSLVGVTDGSSAPA